MFLKSTSVLCSDNFAPIVYNGGGMKRWGFGLLSGPVTPNLMRGRMLSNHLNPNVL